MRTVIDCSIIFVFLLLESLSRFNRPSSPFLLPSIALIEFIKISLSFILQYFTILLKTSYFLISYFMPQLSAVVFSSFFVVYRLRNGTNWIYFFIQISIIKFSPKTKGKIWKEIFPLLLYSNNRYFIGKRFNNCSLPPSTSGFNSTCITLTKTPKILMGQRLCGVTAQNFREWLPSSNGAEINRTYRIWPHQLNFPRAAAHTTPRFYIRPDFRSLKLPQDFHRKCPFQFLPFIRPISFQDFSPSFFMIFFSTIFTLDSALSWLVFRHFTFFNISVQQIVCDVTAFSAYTDTPRYTGRKSDGFTPIRDLKSGFFIS